LLQRPTAATDIYAVGCIAHALATGKPPFAGDMDALRDQHLKTIPPLLEELPPGVKSIVSLMLRKVSELRPKRERCAEVLKQCAVSEGQAVSRAASSMAEAVSLVAVDQAKREAERRVSEEKRRQREALLDVAVRDLRSIKQRLFSRILEHARDVVTGGQGQIQSSRLTLGQAVLTFDTGMDSLQGVRRADQGWGVHPRRSKWDIVTFAEMSIAQVSGQHSYLRSANIVFGRPLEDAEYRWFEMAFWSFGDEKELQGYPSCLRYVFKIDEALSSGMHNMNLGYQPVPIDGENEEAFIEYWMGIVALAATGRLTRPTQMPMPR
jgi:serine/threonine-protein kinase